MMNIAFISIVVLLYPSYCLTQTSKEYFHSLGDTVILLCTLQRESDHINWIFQINTTEIVQYTSDNRTNPNLEGISNRLSVVGNYDLQISTIRKEDEGTYKCQTNINGMIREHFAILSTVRSPTDLLIQNVEGGKVSGTEGHNLELKCTAVGGKPPPEVKLTVSDVSLSVTGNQSVLYTNPQVTRNFDKQTVTCTVDHLGSLSLFEKTAMVYLDLKPLKPTFNQRSISTEETIPLTVSCTSEGSRPPARFQWYIGSTNITTFAKDTSVYIQPTETYTVNSILTYNVNRSYNGKEVTCKVTNIADLIGIQDRKQLDVKYAPDITVNSRNYTQSDAIRLVTCNPSGNPDSYTYDKWQHRSRYGKLIREFNGNKTLRLPDTSNEFKRYQDSGEYICIASNGIKDKDNKFEQTGSVFLIVEAKPVFTSDTIDKARQFGEIGKAIDIYVNVYSVPHLTSYMWARIGKLITTQKSSSSPTIVQDKIYGEEVQLDGYNVTLTILDLKLEDLTNYTVSLTNAFGTAEFTIELESASGPETPGNFSKTATSTTTITLQWDPNFSGGYKQTFYIQYRVQGLLKWIIVSAGEEDINEMKRRRTYQLRKLREGRVYELRMFSENTAMKRSNVTDILIVFTDTAESTTSSAVIGPVVGVVVTLVIVCASFIVILLVKRSRGKDKKEKNVKFYENNGFQDIQKGDKYEDVENKFDVENSQSSKTYETLSTKDKPSVYDDLENAKGVTSLKSSMGVYEALGVKDKPSIYAEIKNQKEQKQPKKQQAGKNQFKKPNDSSEKMEVNTAQEPTEKVYENEVF